MIGRFELCESGVQQAVIGELKWLVGQGVKRKRQDLYSESRHGHLLSIRCGINFSAGGELGLTAMPRVRPWTVKREGRDMRESRDLKFEVRGSKL